MENMENSLYNVIKEHRLLEYGLGNVEKFKQALKRFYNHLKDNQEDPIIGNVLDVHYEVLSKLRQFIKHKHMGNADIKKLHDAIFIELLSFPKTKTPTPITKLFEEFIKGISYFKYQDDPSNPIPIYHRFFSCGVGTEIYRGNNLVCDSNITKNERNRRRPLIDRCYLERLIYDELYKKETLHFPQVGTNVEHHQDKGHIFRMDLTREDFESCFKDHSIDVEIKYNGRFPETLIITRKKKGNVICVEEYIQEVRNLESVVSPYTGIVTCKKKLANGVEYLKIQTFAMEGDWKRIPSST